MSKKYRISDFYRDEIVTTMEDARLIVDGLETNVGKKYWPYPSYGENALQYTVGD